MCWCNPSIRSPYCGKTGCALQAQLPMSIRTEAAKLVWRDKMTKAHLVDANLGLIMATIQEGREGVWEFDGRAYIDQASAKAAAERRFR